MHDRMSVADDSISNEPLPWDVWDEFIDDMDGTRKSNADAFNMAVATNAGCNSGVVTAVSERKGRKAREIVPAMPTTPFEHAL